MEGFLDPLATGQWASSGGRTQIRLSCPWTSHTHTGRPRLGAALCTTAAGGFTSSQFVADTPMCGQQQPRAGCSRMGSVLRAEEGREGGILQGQTHNETGSSRATFLISRLLSACRTTHTRKEMCVCTILYPRRSRDVLMLQNVQKAPSLQDNALRRNKWRKNP